MSENRRPLNREEEERRRRRAMRLREERRRRKRRKAILIRIACVAVLCLVAAGIVFGVRSSTRKREEAARERKVRQEEQARREAEKKAQNQNVAEQADLLAAGYDYDGAVNLIKKVENYEEDTALTAKITAYEKDKAGMVPYDVGEVAHVSFYTLIVDWERASASEDGTVQAMNGKTMTVDDFNQTLQQMYEEGYVLVSVRDLVKEIKDDQGNVTYEKGEILLPQGKKPFVLSQADVSYPLALSGAGYGSRLVADGEGNLSVEYRQADDTVVAGDYDVVPCLETFIAGHRDFSYRGARGILGLTGYNGILGYRTDEDLAKSGEEGNDYAAYGTFDPAAEAESSRAVIHALEEKGWEFAANGYGGVSYASTYDRIQDDAQKWIDRVGSLIGGTDLLMYPGGTDIASWSDYSDQNPKYTYLKSLGFHFFFPADNVNDYWVQIRPGYVRQAMRSPKPLGSA